MKFIDAFRKGVCDIMAIDDYINEWHESESHETLQEYLGLTIFEYEVFLMYGYRELRDLLKTW